MPGGILLTLFRFKEGTAAVRHSGGVHPPNRKNTESCATVAMPVPKRVSIPMVQHIGAACIPCVTVGETVCVGQKVGDSEAFVSAPIHSSVSGKVVSIGSMVTYGTRPVTTVVIETDGLQTLHGAIAPPAVASREDFLKAVRASGLTGLGGAGFPAHVKLAPPKDKPIDTLVVNAAECEPYITSDYRECIERTGDIVSGLRFVMKWAGISKAVVGIEDNKPEAAAALARATAGVSGVSVVSMRTLYPQGAERMLVRTLAGRRIRTGGLPADVGCVVMNVGSVAFLGRYEATGMPLVSRRLTVDGPVCAKPANVEVPLGTAVREVFDFCGGFNGEPFKVLMGGPMMGTALFNLDVPVIKNNNALLAFDRLLGDLPPETACIRCGRCAEACPLSLMPMEINRVVLRGMPEELERYNPMDCIECGCCSYSCPAKRHLVQSIRLAKERMIKNKK